MHLTHHRECVLTMRMRVRWRTEARLYFYRSGQKNGIKRTDDKKTHLDDKPLQPVIKRIIIICHISKCDAVMLQREMCEDDLVKRDQFKNT